AVDFLSVVVGKIGSPIAVRDARFEGYRSRKPVGNALEGNYAGMVLHWLDDGGGPISGFGIRTVVIDVDVRSVGGAGLRDEDVANGAASNGDAAYGDKSRCGSEAVGDCLGGSIARDGYGAVLCFCGFVGVDEIYEKFPELRTDVYAVKDL